MFADSNGQNSLGSLLTAGGIAGAFGSFLAVSISLTRIEESVTSLSLKGVNFCGSVWQTPMDVVKTRLQESGGSTRYKGIPDCFSKISKQEGIRALFKGAVPRMCVVAPLFGISLVAFEKQKEYLIKTGRL